MKKLWYGLFICLLINEVCMAHIVGKKAPDFSAQAIINGEIKHVSLSDYQNFYKLLVFYPLDFTFVCPTELHELQAQLDKFTQLNVVVMAISVDSVYAHLAWLSNPKELGGIQGITYPLVSDINKTIARDYDVLDESGVALRGAFIIDHNNIIQCALINNFPIGRSVDEMLRLIEAVQHVEKYGEVCPVNWQEGQEGMSASAQAVINYFQHQSHKSIKPRI